MKAIIAFAVLALSALSSATPTAEKAGPVRYDNHRVVEFKIDNDQQLNVLQTFIDNDKLGLDLWTESCAPCNVQVRIPPESFAALSGSSLFSQVAHRTVIEDIQPLIDAEKLSAFEYLAKKGRTSSAQEAKELKELEDVDPFFTKYHTFDEIDVNAQYSDSTTVSKLQGQTFKKRNWEYHGDFFTRKMNGIRSYYEYIPVRPVSLTRDWKMYRKFELGSLADLVLLDTRLWGRDDPNNADNAEIQRENRTILGFDQEDWLHETLQTSTKKWKIIGNQIIFAPWRPLIFHNVIINKDCWDGYPHARQRLLSHIERHNISNTVFLTGDVHSSWIHEVPRDPWSKNYNPRTGNGSLAVEFVLPPVTSEFALEFLGVQGLAPFVHSALWREPHLRWVDLVSKGYGIVTVSPEQLLVEYRVLASVKSWTEPREFSRIKVKVEDGVSVAKSVAGPTLRSRRQKWFSPDKCGCISGVCEVDC